MYFNTSLLHGKNTAQYADGATLVPVFQSNAFCCQTMEDLERVFSHKKSGFAYSRIGNPTVAAFEQRISELEGGIGAVAASSGMAAVSHTLLSLLIPGDEIIASGCLYGGTIGLFDDLERLGIHTHFVSRLDEESIQAAVTSRTRCVFGEVIANPALSVLNIREAARAAHTAGLPLIVDNTTATPFLCRPFSLGADIVIHSASKYIVGSGDAISGVVVDGGSFSWDRAHLPALAGFEKFGKLAFLMRLRTDIHENLGGCLSPMNAFLGTLGLETLGLRMERICENAARLAEALKGAGIPVKYPALDESPCRDLCREQFRGLGGGILTFRTGSAESARKVINRLRYACIASNIGDIRTLVLLPSTTIFLKNTDRQKTDAGVFEDTVRVSVGIEDAEDLIEDFLTALEACQE
ncbi:MAG: O-acetylhomoserine aminocarboxypropyltransferase/cysteine synthase [Lachnospiraceae bacterium]|nr:O-acetylhomoserine aminocarboxypropyltransferase/cysteine synthase [Lachnospiraceae bacterium]